MINFNNCFKLTDDGIASVTATNQQLHSVRLRFTSITDKSLSLLAKAGNSLRRVDFSGCKKVTNVGLQALAQACSQLIEVNISGCDKISSAGVAGLGKGCRNLLHLKMAHLYLVKDDAVKVRGKMWTWVNVLEECYKWCL